MKTLASSSTKNRSAIFTNKYSKNNLLTISLLILYLVSIFIQQKIITATELKAIFAQIQVLISICMVLVGNKKSYIASVSVNLFTCIIVFIFFFTSKNRSFIPGTLVPLITIFSISIIYLINMKLNNTINKLKENNEILEKSGKELDKLANYDYLTGLPNRKMIFNKIDDLIEKSSKSSSTFSLVYIDVDNFKNINDTLGHPIGDLLLQSITARFKTIIDSNDFLGRLGGDEFALIIQKNLSKEDTLKYVRKLMSLLFEPFNINNIKFSINFSCGISIFPEDGEISSELLKNSDTAMYNVKSQGKNDINFFTKKMRDDIIKKMEIAYHLSFSIKNEELFLVFQPQYTTYSKKLRGFESLLRWKSGKLGTISPGDFIPIAEEMGYINLLGKWVLEESCKKLKLWHDTYNTDINMSINISAVQINDPSFLNIVYKILKDTGVNPKCLEFEITESIFVSTMDYATDVLNKLKELGIKIALDDFGKGYSSLSYICSFPIDSLKIDKSFIDDITTNEKKDSIVGSIISLVHDLDISVISEGIETTEQLQCLKCHSCDYIQGFLWGKPLFEEAAENLLSEQNNVIC